MNEHVVPESFPIRPVLRDGESLGGWCWRVYPANGHLLPKNTRSALLEIRAYRVLQPDNSLSRLMGFERLKPLHERENTIIDPWSRQLAPRWYAWSRRPRFCVLCMAQCECHLVCWDLPLVSACAVHGCLLTTRCHSCGSTWSWPTLKQGWRCNCGARIAEGLAQDAPLLEVSFSRGLCAASDALVPPSVKSASFGAAPINTAYRTRDVYETLGWLLKLRRALTDPVHPDVPKSWPMVPRRGARMAPGSWEKSLLTGSSHTINRKARQTLRWLFKDSFATLVDLRNVDRWSGVERLMTELSADRNPMSGPIFSAIDRARLEHHAGIPGQESILFNPRLSRAERSERLAELTAWLRLLSGEEDANGSKEKSAPHQIVGVQVSALTGNRTGAATGFLNFLFELAQQGITSSDFGKMERTELKGSRHAS